MGGVGIPQLRWTGAIRSALTWVCDGPDSRRKQIAVCALVQGVGGL